MGDVLQFGELTLQRKREQARYLRDGKTCAHRRLELDDEGDIVRCLDCTVQVSAYWSLRTFIEYWLDHKRSVDSARERLKAEADGKIHLIAARRMERIWRTRQMLPACPHCHRGLLPTDSLGSVNKEMEVRRREVERASEQRSEDTK